MKQSKDLEKYLKKELDLLSITVKNWPEKADKLEVLLDNFKKIFEKNKVNIQDKKVIEARIQLVEAQIAKAKQLLEKKAA